MFLSNYIYESIVVSNVLTVYKRQVLSFLVGILLIILFNVFVKPFYISSIIAYLLACELMFHTITLYNCIHLIPVGPIADDTCAAVIKSENKPT